MRETIRTNGFLACQLICTAMLIASVHAASAAVGASTDSLNSAYIEKNVGHASDSVDYIVRATRYAAFIQRDRLSFIPLGLSAGQPQDSEAVELYLLGAAPEGDAPAASPAKARSHYYLGSTPDRWIRDVPHVSDVRYRHIYPGVDVVYRIEHGDLRYDFELEPGVDPSSIRLAFRNARTVATTPTGDLRVSYASFQQVHRAPRVFQLDGDSSSPVAGEFVVDEDMTAGFRVGKLDPTRPATIDPTLVFTSLLGASDADSAMAVAVSDTGEVWTSGTTLSGQLATRLQRGGGTDQDAFLARYTDDGQLLDIAIFGGSGVETPLTMGLDSQGNPHVTGTTNSTDFPVANADQSQYAGGEDVDFAEDVFLVKYAAHDSTFVYATYLGGTDLGIEVLTIETVRGMHIDSADNVYVVGETGAPDFPATDVFDNRPCVADDLQPTHSSFVGDAFVAKYSPSGDRMLAFCFGSNDRDAARAVHADAAGHLYINGHTRSDTFPVTPGAFQTERIGNLRGYDAFVIKIDPTTMTSVFGTFVGGSDSDFSQASVLAPDGSLYVVGETESQDFPTTEGALQTSFSGEPGIISNVSDGFVFRLNPSGSSLVFSTYLGGVGPDDIDDIVLSESGDIFLAGSTASADFPVFAAVQPEKGAAFSREFISEDNHDTRAMAMIRPASNFIDHVVIATDSQNWAFIEDDETGWRKEALGTEAYDSRDVTAYYNRFLYEVTGVAVANNGAPNLYYEAAPDGGFLPPVALGAAESNASYAIASGDMGLVVGNYGQNNKVYRSTSPNDSVTDLPGLPGSTTSVVIVELNNDGVDDIVFGNDNEPNRFHIGINYGLAYEDADLSLDIDPTYAVNAQDLDRNGYIDIVAGNYGAPDKVYLNYGDEQFSEGLPLSDASDLTRRIMFFGINFDDFIDIVAAGDYGLKYYINNGDGSFELLGTEPDFGPVTAAISDDDYNIAVTCPDCVFNTYSFFAGRPMQPDARFFLTPSDTFVTVLSPDAARISFSTFFGGTGSDTLHRGLEVRSGGEIFLAGGTAGRDLLGVSGEPSNAFNAFLVRIDVDADRDGILDPIDNCSSIDNPLQVDSDEDGFGNRCDADLNNDCIVNFTDLALLKAVFFTADPDGDFDNDGLVSFSDLQRLKESFFRPPGPGGELSGC